MLKSLVFLVALALLVSSTQQASEKPAKKTTTTTTAATTAAAAAGNKTVVTAVNANATAVNGTAGKSATTEKLNELKIVACPLEKGKKYQCTMTMLNINNEKSYPVNFVRNTSASVSFDLVCQSKVAKVNLKITGNISGRDVPFPVTDKDHMQTAMKHKGALVKAKTYNYRYQMAVLPQYPLVSVVVKYELCDDKNKPLVCFSFPAKIVEK